MLDEPVFCRPRFVWFVFVLCCACGSSASAEIIAHFGFNVNNYTVDPANTVGANVDLDLSNSANRDPAFTVSPLKFSSALDPTAALGFAADDYDGALGFSNDVNDARNLLTNAQAVYFEIDVDTAFRLSLISLEFQTLKTRGGADSSARLTYSTFVNPSGDPDEGLVGGFDFVAQDAHDHTATGGSGAESTGGPFSTGVVATGEIDLRSFTALTGRNVVAIRLYGSPGVDQDFGIDEVVLRGEITAVPEPEFPLFLFLAAIVGVTSFRFARTGHGRALQQHRQRPSGN